MELSNKRVTVLGLAESGFSAAKLLKRIKAKVRISESREGEDVKAKLKSLGDVESEIGTHTKDFIERSDLIITSPGIPSHAEPLRWASASGIPVISEMELGYMFCVAPIVSLTGTNGKSTTVSLLYEMLKANGIQSYLLGNIGRPICEDVLKINPSSIVVLEASSFQLEAIKDFRPKIAILLNITQNHLDRYRDMDEYRKAKLRMFENQKGCDYAILNYDDPRVKEISENIKSNVFYFSMKQRVKGSYIEGDRLFADLGDGPVEICKINDVRLPGRHNLENVLAAALALKLIDNKADTAPTVKNFIGLRHRFEVVAEIEGVKFIDDSKSTTVDSTLKALESFSGKNVVLIAGGKDKGSDYSPIRLHKEKIKNFILIGETRRKIKNAIGYSNVPIEEVATLQEAVLLSRKISMEGDTVLLSPMCSSFDMFKDYKERGDVFRKAVFDTLISSGISSFAEA